MIVKTKKSVSRASIILNRRALGLCIAPILLSFAPSAQAQVWMPDSHSIAIEGDPMMTVDTDRIPAGAGANSPAETETYASLGGVRNIAFSPVGTTVAFVTSDGKLMMAPSLKEAAKILEVNIISPIVWSPDGKFIGCVRSVDKGGLEYRSISIEGGVSSKSALPFTKMSLGSRSVSWVPNTDNVILAGGDGFKSDLYLIEQGQVVPLTMNGEVQGFKVSANGENVRWAQKSRNTHYILMSLYDTNIAKRTATKLDFPDRLPAVNPKPTQSADGVSYVVFAPDLSRFAFETYEKSGAKAKKTLWTSDISGNGVQSLLSWQSAPKPVMTDANASPQKVTALQVKQDSPAKTEAEKPSSVDEDIRQPAYSQDGKWLAFVTNAEGRNSISLFDSAGAKRKAILGAK